MTLDRIEAEREKVLSRLEGYYLFGYITLKEYFRLVDVYIEQIEKEFQQDKKVKVSLIRTTTLR